MTPGAHRRRSRLGWVARYAFRRKALLALIIGLTLFSSILMAAEPIPLKVVVDNALAGEELSPFMQSITPSSTRGLIVWGGIALVAILGISALLGAVLSWLWAVAGARTAQDLMIDTFDALQRRSLAFHSRRPIGDSIDRIVTDGWVGYAVMQALLVTPVTQLFMIAFVLAAALTLEAAQMQLRHGVTSIRDSYGALGPLKQVRDAIARGEAIGPRMLVAGNIVGWGGPYSVTFALIGERDLSLYEEQFTDSITQRAGEELMDMYPEELRVAINKYLDKGPDFIKYGGTGHFTYPSMIGFSPDQQRVLVEEAHRRGKLLFAHPSNREGLMNAVRGGADVIVHTAPNSGAWDDTVLGPMRKAGVALIPTLKLWKHELQHDRDTARDAFVGAGVAQLRAWLAAGSFWHSSKPSSSHWRSSSLQIPEGRWGWTDSCSAENKHAAMTKGELSATPQGTGEYRDQFAGRLPAEHFRQSHAHVLVERPMAHHVVADRQAVHRRAHRASTTADVGSRSDPWSMVTTGV